MNHSGDHQRDLIVDNVEMHCRCLRDWMIHPLRVYSITDVPGFQIAEKWIEENPDAALTVEILWLRGMLFGAK